MADLWSAASRIPWAIWLGAALLGAAGVSALVFGIRARMGQEVALLRKMLWPVAVAGLLLCAVAFLAHRASWMDALLRPAVGASSGPVRIPLVPEESSISLMTGVSVALWSVLSLLAGLLVPGRSPVHRAGTAFAWVLVAIASGALVALAHETHLDLSGCGAGWSFPYLEFGSGPLYAVAKGLVVGVAAAGCLVVILLRPARSSDGPKPRRALALLSAGLMIFLVTRGYAHDARIRIPVEDGRAGRFYSLFHWMSQMDTCDADRMVNFLYSDPSERGPTIDGEILPDRDQLTAKLLELERKLRDLHSMAGDPSEAELDVDLAVSVEAKMDTVLPVLEAMRAAGRTEVNAVGVRTRNYETRTKGTLRHRIRCARRFALGDGGLAPLRFATWGELLIEAERGPFMLDLSSDVRAEEWPGQ